MATLPILTYPDPRLKQVSAPVDSFGPELHTLLEDMFDTMLAARGIGLAAPQVGHPIRAFVLDLGLQEGFESQRYEFINPRLSDASGRVSFEEGCLSVPGVGESVVRKNSVRVDFQDRHGTPQSLHAQGLLSVAIQHENDHLDGILFVDRLSALKRLFVGRRLRSRVTL